MKNTVKGALIASAVCALFSTGAVNAAEGKATKDTGKEVKCAGIKECTDKGGKVMAAK